MTWLVTGAQEALIPADELAAQLGLDPSELAELVRWGLRRRGSERGFRPDVVQGWVAVVTRFPGVLLQTDFAAAHVGLSKRELTRRPDLFAAAQTVLSDDLYWKHRLDRIYRAGLEPGMTYGSLLDSHRAFARCHDLRLASCVVCGQAAVSTICEECRSPVDPAHCEPVRDGRPLRFRPAEVCFNCIRKRGTKAFEFFRDRRSIRAVVDRASGPS